MAAKTKSAADMDDVQSQLRLFLEELGYRWRARTCNRKTNDGLTHVLYFQLGQRSLQGKFTLNVGVYVPEAASAQYGSAEPSFVQEPSCCIRRRLGELGPEQRDLWWKLPLRWFEIPGLKRRLKRDALPFLARFETRDSILQELTPLKGNTGGGMPNRIVCAILLAHRGESEAARAMLAAQIHETANPGHADYIQKLSERLGLGRIER